MSNTLEAPSNPAAKNNPLPSSDEYRGLRKTMFIISGINCIITVIIITIGAINLGQCLLNHYGDWGMLIGSILFSLSAVTTASIHGRQRFVALWALGVGTVVGLIAVIIGCMAIVCLDVGYGQNQNRGICSSFMNTVNSCSFVEIWVENAVFETVGTGNRICHAVFITIHVVIDVGLWTLATTKAGRMDLCQFEDALRELNDANAYLTYRKRAKRNKILCQYISQAKPEETEGYGAKLRRFFSFGADVEPIEPEDRRVKLVLPASNPEPTKKSDAGLID